MCVCVCVCVENFLTRCLDERACTFCSIFRVILVHLSSNFTKITLHRACFPVCLLHDGSNFQGHLC